MKVKNVQVSTKAGPDAGLAEGEFEAYASVFGNVDSYGDIVVKGAFAESLKEWADSGNTLPVLWGHNMSDPDYNIGGVSVAVEDDRGLRIRAQLDLDAPKAAQVYRLLKAGRVSQMSFAFDVLDCAPVEKYGVDAYELRRLKLYEVSVVPIGANQETEVLAVKAAASVVAQGVKEGRALSQKNVDALRTARDAIDEVLSSAVDEGKSSGDPADRNGEAPAGGKSEAGPGVAARRLAIELDLLALAGSNVKEN